MTRITAELGPGHLLSWSCVVVHGMRTSLTRVMVVRSAT